MKNRLLGAYIARSHKGLLTETEMNVLNENNPDDLISTFVHLKNDKYNQQIASMLKSMDYFMDGELVLENVVETDRVVCSFLGTQIMSGSDEVFLGIGGEQAALCELAGDFAMEHYVEFDADAYDAICEMINCINGAYATLMSNDREELVIHPPAFYENLTVNAGNKMYKAEMSLNNMRFDVIMAINGEIKLVTNK